MLRRVLSGPRIRGTCANTGTIQNNVTLSGGTAESSSHGPLAAGSYSFKVHYDGDAAYTTADSACEPLLVGLGEPNRLTLTPATATNTVGDEHCVTATVTDFFGNPVSGVTVRFSVPTYVATSANPSSGSDVTDANGEATFCYSASLPGEDMIHAYADTNNNGTQNADEPFGDATKTWILPLNTAFCEVTITQGGWIIANNGDRANFGGNAKVAADGSTVQGQEEYQDQGPAQPRNVHSIELLATTCSNDMTSATIFGTATKNGSGMFVFRIDVTDMGSPGTNDSYGIILSDGYVSGQKQLQGGNVTIHK